MTHYRGQVIRVRMEHLAEAKLYLVVSNNRRNQNLGTMLAVRLTTSDKPVLPSIIELPTTEEVTGRVLCDDIVEVYDDEVIQVVSSLTHPTMSMVNRGLAAALDLP